MSRYILCLFTTFTSFGLHAQNTNATINAPLLAKAVLRSIDINYAGKDSNAIAVITVLFSGNDGGIFQKNVQQLNRTSKCATQEKLNNSTTACYTKNIYCQTKLKKISAQPLFSIY